MRVPPSQPQHQRLVVRAQPRIICICVYTNDIWEIPLRTRSKAPREFDSFLGQQATGDKENLKNLMAVGTDCAKELTQGDMKTVVHKWGFRMLECTSPYSSYQNANAERAIRTIVNMARTMMIHAQAPRHEWIYALRTATYILRRLPTTANPGRRAPIQMRLNSDNPINLAYLRTWYARVVVRKQAPEQTKSERFDENGWSGRFLGYREGVKGYTVRIQGRTLTRSPRDVYFIEDI